MGEINLNHSNYPHKVHKGFVESRRKRIRAARFIFIWKSETYRLKVNLVKFYDGKIPYGF